MFRFCNDVDRDAALSVHVMERPIPEKEVRAFVETGTSILTHAWDEALKVPDDVE
jgi:hypothetical protein